MLENRNAEMKVEEDACQDTNEVDGTKNVIKNTRTTTSGAASKTAMASQVPSVHPTTKTTSARPTTTTTTRSRSRKEPSQALEVGSLMQYMRKTKPPPQPKKRS